jgi:hypothetical protein
MLLDTECCMLNVVYAINKHFMLNIVMLSIIALSIIMLSIIMLIIIMLSMLNVIMTNVIMLSIVSSLYALPTDIRLRRK